MDPISETDQQSALAPPTPTPSSAVSFSSIKMPASPRSRPAMPAGPRIIRKATTPITITTSTTNGPSIASNGRRASIDSIVAFTSGRNSPSPSSSIQSPTLDRRCFEHPVMEEKEVQTDHIVAPLPTPPPLLPTPTPRSPPSLSTPAFKVNPKPVTLPVPSPINFRADPVSFRGLTLEAAQWTFSSDELREVVSRAIRDSAKESFIKLLSLDVLDREVPTELERLETLKFTTQAQHRFHFQRRTNLLQSLNALATTIPYNSEDGVSPLASLTSQLAEITAAMDRFTESLLHAADHKAQLAHVQETHLSSALAMALRKLNASYSKRTSDLKQAQAKIEELKSELEEAWKVATELAQELDDLENFEEDYGMVEDEEGGGKGDPTVDGDEDFTTSSAVSAELVPITGKAFVSKATLVASPTSETSADAATFPPTPKRERAQSTSSAGKGVSSGRGRSSKVSAARRRSVRTSKANLRLPKLPGASGSEGSASGTSTPIRRRSKKSPTELPSVPPIPSRVGLNPNGQMNTSFLELSRPGSPQQSDEEMPSVPELESMPAAEQMAGANDDTPVSSAVADGSFITQTSIYPESDLALETSSTDRQLNQMSFESGTSSHQRNPSAQSSTFRSSMMSKDSMLVNVDEVREEEQDSPVVPGLNRPSFDEQHRRVSVPERSQKKPTSGYDKVDRWTLMNPRRLSISVNPYPPLSPASSFVPALETYPEDSPVNTNRRQKSLVSSSIFRFKNRRRSMPMPSATMATLLPWHGDAQRPSSEPELPSQTSSQYQSPS